MTYTQTSSFLSSLLLEKAVSVSEISIVQDNARPNVLARSASASASASSSPLMQPRRPSMQDCRWRSDPVLPTHHNRQQQSQSHHGRANELELEQMETGPSRWGRRDSDSTLIKPSRREFLIRTGPSTKSVTTTTSVSKSTRRESPYSALEAAARIIQNDEDESIFQSLSGTQLKEDQDVSTSSTIDTSRRILDNVMADCNGLKGSGWKMENLTNILLDLPLSGSPDQIVSAPLFCSLFDPSTTNIPASHGNFATGDTLKSPSTSTTTKHKGEYLPSFITKSEKKKQKIKKYNSDSSSSSSSTPLLMAIQ